MRYNASEIVLSDVWSMFSALEADMTTFFEENVMLGAPHRAIYDSVSDDPSEQGLGYSFLEDKRNNFLGHRETLLNHILHTPELRQHFTRQHNNTLVWSKTALRQWLADYSRLSILHLLRCEMLSGGPARGTELTAMMYRSGKGRGARNLVVIGHHLVMRRTYSKTSALNGKDRHIPHSLDGFESDLLIQDLVLARPFAEFAAHTCWPDDGDKLTLYQFHLFVNFDKLFTTTDISGCMAHYTLGYLHTRFTVRYWRHISIAWRRKLCPGHIDFLDDDILEDHIGAEQTGHSARTERLKYAISPEALAGPSEDSLPLFLDASARWQEKMRVVPGMFFLLSFIVYQSNCLLQVVSSCLTNKHRVFALMT